MKLAIFAVFIIGLSFAGSLSVGDLLQGGAESDAGDGSVYIGEGEDSDKSCEHFVEGLTALGSALKKTANCDTSVSSEQGGQLATNITLLAEDISDFAAGDPQATSHLNSVAVCLKEVADDILSDGLPDKDDLNSAFEKFAQSLAQLNAASAKTTGVSKLVMNLGSDLTGIHKCVHDASAGFKYAKESAEDYNANCKTSSGLPESLGHVLKQIEKTDNNLKLLNLS